LLFLVLFLFFSLLSFPLSPPDNGGEVIIHLRKVVSTVPFMLLYRSGQLVESLRNPGEEQIKAVFAKHAAADNSGSGSAPVFQTNGPQVGIASVLLYSALFNYILIYSILFYSTTIYCSDLVYYFVLLCSALLCSSL